MKPICVRWMQEAYAYTNNGNIATVNCLPAQINKEIDTRYYKAKPLNGIRATAPFLHNGSVPTLKDLLCKDVGERPRYVELGRLEFDSEAIGLPQPFDFEKMAAKRLASGQQYTKNGYFILDTQVPGNLNSGHYFSSRYDLNKSEQATGIIGPKLSTTECEAMLEYLKTL